MKTTIEALKREHEKIVAALRIEIEDLRKECSVAHENLIKAIQRNEIAQKILSGQMET